MVSQQKIMQLKIGFMQGRLSPLVNNQIQSFPLGNWENDFPIALTYNAIAGDEENWNKPITQTTLVKNCKAF